MNHGLRIAEEIIAHLIVRNHAKTIQPQPELSLLQKETSLFPKYASVFKEQPKALNMFDVNPHQYATVTAGELNKQVWNFIVPEGYVFHIEQLALNGNEDVSIILQIDGANRETIDRFYGEINSPVNVKGRFMTASRRVRFVVSNSSDEDAVVEVLCDGTLYNVEDWPRIRDSIMGG